MLSAKYTPSDIEDKWYSHWESNKYFASTPDEREPFSIVIPPPNVTGVLHMGHMLNNTIQDILIRKARMDGKNACWVPGTDHASIATEAKVVKWLREEKGITKGSLTRDEFMAYAFQWKEKYGGIILQQLRKLGSSCDWDRTAFTMDEVRSQGVTKVFVDLYNKGKLYRSLRMVNWDPEAKTVLSNEEVLHNEEQSNLYHVQYLVEGSDNEWITIATQRPETIMGDTAVAVNPKDPRYAHLQGKRVIVPLVNRSVPIIFDEYVDIEFGTGALKVTPAHDPNDYELGKKYNLEVIDTLNEDGTLNEKAQFFVGMDRFEARKKMKKALEESGNFIKLESYKTSIGRSERTGSVVEPRLSLQWYVDMKAIAAPALTNVMDDTIEFFPKSFKNVYRHWMENIRDWCISRQLWWGHRIPAWYVTNPLYTVGGEVEKQMVFVSETEEGAYAQYLEFCADNHVSPLEGEAGKLVQDDDAMDTWFSSWLWPITVFDGFNPDSEDFKYYYPTNVLVTGWDIIFLWVARMAMAGFEWKQERPFKSVYFTGMVRDKQRRKMSKSLGNSPDALQLIEDFGADGVRFGVMASSPAGGDLLFDEKLCEQGRNFANKLWNALRLVKGWEVTDTLPANIEGNRLAAAWFNQKMQKVVADLEASFIDFRLSEALMSLYNFIWDDFCSWYLEMIKPTYGAAVDKETLATTIQIFEKLMVILHPFMPFVTEEIWHQLSERISNDDVCRQFYPKVQSIDNQLVASVESAKDLVGKIRDVRNKEGLKMAEQMVVFANNEGQAATFLANNGWKNIVEKLANLKTFDLVNEEPESCVNFLSGTEKYYVEVHKTIDVEVEKKRISEELDYAKGFVNSVQKKLENERFVAGAPAQVLENERKKLEDGLSKVRMLSESLSKLG